MLLAYVGTLIQSYRQYSELPRSLFKLTELSYIFFLLVFLVRALFGLLPILFYFCLTIYIYIYKRYFFGLSGAH